MGLCKAGRVEIAIKLLKSLQMKGMVLTPHAYNPVIQTLCKRKRTSEAMRLFIEMMEKGDPPDAVSYKILFRGLCNGGGPIQEAVDFTIEMLEKGILPEFQSFGFLAEGLCSLSREDTLIRLINMVMEKGRFSQSETSIIKGLLRIQKFNNALPNLGAILDRKKPRRF
ncbi:pentatricopeptide repeat-containing protein At3g53700, chloroplastic-like [Vigna umbellata]|uniref:pentatricopeptide repeat-containing protein At3g53700, chloroplastic-like n=1 Tax=Vigna umbellata TaxID=87088 RepID=UPI001F5E977C|nr:pentatricopeptide repeat-containing protein At3g53700, chloroplastic-like [Vigna umbellata]